MNLYPRFIEPVVRTHRDFGIAAVYRPVNGYKIGGTGAASIGEATVMVGSFMFDFDTAMMARCLKVPSEKFRDKLRQTLDDYMTTMTKELTTPPARADVLARFLTHCAVVLGVTPDPSRPTPAEQSAIASAAAKLSDPVLSAAPGHRLRELGVKIYADTHLAESAHKAPGGLIRAALLSQDGRIADLVISGDLTCLPPDGIDRLSAALKGTELDAPVLTAEIARWLNDTGLDLPGVTATDLAAAILAARPG